MTIESLGEIIATRKLTRAQDGGVTSEVFVFLGKPVLDPTSPNFYCPYQIKGIGDEKIRAVFGVDEFQALALALSILPVELDAMGKNSGSTLRWEDGEVGDFGDFGGSPSV